MTPFIILPIWTRFQHFINIYIKIINISARHKLTKAPTQKRRNNKKRVKNLIFFYQIIKLHFLKLQFQAKQKKCRRRWREKKFILRWFDEETQKLDAI